MLCEENLYGCTVRLFEQVFAKFGLRSAWVDFTRPEALQEIRSHKPAMVWLESPTNPLLKVIDLQEADSEEVSELLAAVAAVGVSKPVLRRFKRELAALRGQGETFA